MKRIKRFLLLFLLVAVVIPTAFSATQEDKDSFGNLFIFGVTSSYLNYDPKELSTFTTNTNKDYFLGGISIGFLANNWLFDFSYLSKFYPINVDEIANNYKLTHNFDSYTLEIGYIWNFFKGLLFLGPSISFSLDTSSIKLFKNVSVASPISDWVIKNIYSKTLSLGIGLKLFVTRYIKLSIGYRYGFPNNMNYEGVPLEGAEVFQPSGVIASITLGL